MIDRINLETAICSPIEKSANSATIEKLFKLGEIQEAPGTGILYVDCGADERWYDTYVGSRDDEEVPYHDTYNCNFGQFRKLIETAVSMKTDCVFGYLVEPRLNHISHVDVQVIDGKVYFSEYVYRFAGYSPTHLEILAELGAIEIKAENLWLQESEA